MTAVARVGQSSRSAGARWTYDNPCRRSRQAGAWTDVVSGGTDTRKLIQPSCVAVGRPGGQLLDAVGALGVLPSLPLDGDRPNAEQRLAAGAEDVCVQNSLVPMLVPTSGRNCSLPVSAGNLTENRSLTAEALSATAGTNCDLLGSTGKKRATGLEPATFSLEGDGDRTQSPQSQGLATGCAVACTSACTNSAAAQSTPCCGGKNTFAVVLTMLATLPLSDAEKAEAVRRLIRPCARS